METSAQLRGGLAREGHGGEVLDLVRAGRDPRSHALGEHLRLARTGARFDEDVGVELLADDPAGFLVLQRDQCASSATPS